MRVNLNDPQSIVAFFRVNPKRHGPQIAWFAKAWPQFASAISRAGQLLKSRTDA